MLTSCLGGGDIMCLKTSFLSRSTLSTGCGQVPAEASVTSLRRRRMTCVQTDGLSKLTQAVIADQVVQG